MQVYLIRHTHVGVTRGTCYGQTDVPLAETFLTEAAITKRNIKDIHFDKVYSSPLTRAYKLACYCGYPEADRDDRLKEMNMGEWEMQKYEEIKDDALQMWYNDYMHLACTGGESYPMLYARVKSFLDELRTKPYKRVAIFAHGGVLICAGVYSGIIPEEKAFEYLTDYGCLEIIEI
jgi:alpha-ribazole phosphatase